MSIERRGLLFVGALAAPALLRAGAAQAQTAPAAPAGRQSPSFYRFKVGNFTVTMLHDGFFTIPVRGFIPNAPAAELEQTLAGSFLGTETLTIPFTITAVDTGRHLVMLDTGTAGMNPTSQLLPANMRAAGIDPAKVTHVVVSHFHGDHINGLLSGAEATYPNAEVVVPETEWAWWADEGNTTRSPERQRPNFANTKRRFAPYAGRVRRIQDGAEAVPGIRAMAAHGHTPGHTCYHIADGADQAMFLADLTNRPEIFARNPGWHAVFDFDAPTAEANRRRVLDRVAAERMRVTAYHYPFPANGYMAKEGNGYRFHLADWSSQV